MLSLSVNDDGARLTGGSLKKDSMPLIVASSSAFLLAGRDNRNSVTGPRRLTLRLSGKTGLP